MSNFIVVGTNHLHSPVEIRERISFTKKERTHVISQLKDRQIFEEAVILSTCNRIEIYAIASERSVGIKSAEDIVARFHGIEKEVLSHYLYRYTGKEALEHLFSVASGLDSLILGETQIAGQIRSAFLESSEVGFANDKLADVFHSALSFAQKVRAETRISEGKVSIGSVALDFIKERTGSLSGKSVLIVGVGKVTELVLKHLKKEKPDVLFVSNRTFERAKELASQIGRKAVRFDRLNEYIRTADIVITATRSPHFIIKKDMLERQTTNEKRGLLILDLAMPRDVDPAIKAISNVELFYLEDLTSVIEKNMAGKLGEAVKAWEILKKELDKIWEEISESAQEEAVLR